MIRKLPTISSWAMEESLAFWFSVVPLTGHQQQSTDLKENLAVKIKGFYKPTHEWETTFGPCSPLGVLFHQPCPTPWVQLPTLPPPRLTPFLRVSTWPLYIAGSRFTLIDRIKICIFSPISYNSFTTQCIKTERSSVSAFYYFLVV